MRRYVHYRLFVNQEQSRLLMACLAESCTIYNSMLADRLTKSLKRYLAAKHNDIAGVGFPRFKKPNRWHSIQLRQYGKDCYLHEDKPHLIVPKKLGHFLKIKPHRPLEGTPKTVHLVHRAEGHWYALIVCSNRRKKAARNVAKTHLKINRQRRDHHFKIAKPYADGYRCEPAFHEPEMSSVWRDRAQISFCANP